MMRKSAPQPCPVVWPLEPGQGDLIAPAILEQLPGHACGLEAGHVHEGADGTLIVVDGVTVPYRTPHRCHCGAWTPVRDVTRPAGA